MAQKRVSLTVEKKLEVLEYAEKNPKASQGDIARHFSISQPTVSTILRKKDSLLVLASKGLRSVKRNRSTCCNVLEKGMEAYYATCKEKSLNSNSYDLLITKGKAIAEEMQRAGLADAKDVPASDAGWKSYVQWFLKKRSITSKHHGESADADTAAVWNFFDGVWPELFSSVSNDPSCVFNMDETGLF